MGSSDASRNEEEGQQRDAGEEAGQQQGVCRTAGLRQDQPEDKVTRNYQGYDQLGQIAQRGGGEIPD